MPKSHIYHLQLLAKEQYTAHMWLLWTLLEYLRLHTANPARGSNCLNVEVPNLKHYAYILLWDPIPPCELQSIPWIVRPFQ